MIAREVAASQQLNRYYDGTACRKGHIAEKYTRDGYCCECKRLKELSNKQDRALRSKEYYYKNRQSAIEKNKEYAQSNKLVVAERQRIWRLKNRQRIQEYRQRNSGLYAFHAACRRKIVKRQTPTWANVVAIREYYELAARMTRDTGKKYHVDHIVPLKGKNVCGLHCEWNLQVIPASENIQKSNSF